MGPGNGAVGVFSEQLWIWQVTYRNPAGEKSQCLAPGISHTATPAAGGARLSLRRWGCRPALGSAGHCCVRFVYGAGALKACPVIASVTERWRRCARRILGTVLPCSHPLDGETKAKRGQVTCLKQGHLASRRPLVKRLTGTQPCLLLWGWDSCSPMTTAEAAAAQTLGPPRWKHPVADP